MTEWKSSCSLAAALFILLYMKKGGICYLRKEWKHAIIFKSGRVM